MDYLQKLVTDIELQSVDGIRECFENGVNPSDYFKNRPLIYELITAYPRGPKFKECVKVFADYGLDFDDKILLAVLMDDATMLENLLADNPKEFAVVKLMPTVYEAVQAVVEEKINAFGSAGKAVR